MTFPSFNVGEVLTAADMNAVGLWLVKTQSWTNATTTTVNDAFSSNYKNYKIIANVTGSGVAQNLGLRLRTATADIGAGQYAYQTQFVNYTVAGWATGGVTNTANDWTDFVRLQASEEAFGEMDIFGPNTVNVTTMQVRCSDALLHRVGGGYVNNTTAATGFRLVSPNNTSGTVRVYGYRN